MVEFYVEVAKIGCIVVDCRMRFLEPYRRLAWVLNLGRRENARHPKRLNTVLRKRKQWGASQARARPLCLPTDSLLPGGFRGRKLWRCAAGSWAVLQVWDSVFPQAKSSG